MRAIVLEKFGGLDNLVYKGIPEPEPKAGHVVIQIKAFGINHAEMHSAGASGPRRRRSAARMRGIVKSAPAANFRSERVRPQWAASAARSTAAPPNRPGAGVQRRADRGGPAMGRSCRDPRDLPPPGPA